MTTDYDNREMLLARNRLDEIRKAPLADRKDARAKLLDTMRTDPALICERIEWLIGGSCGYGEMLLAKQILAHTRMNRVAALVALIGAFEWQCPDAFVRDAWKQLTRAQQRKLNHAVYQILIAEDASAEATADVKARDERKEPTNVS